MKKTLTLLAIFLTFLGGKSPCLFAAEVATGDQFDYQNFNHGYYPRCERCGCNPCSCANYGNGQAPYPIPQPVAPYPNQAPCQTPCQDPCQTPAPCQTPCQTPCEQPCAASVCGTTCGISICAIGLAVAALYAAAAIIVSSGSGTHAH